MLSEEKVAGPDHPAGVHAPQGLVGGALAGARKAWGALGLPGKLLLMTAAFVMLSEILIFLPSVSTFRVNWLGERLTTAELAALAAESFPGGGVPPPLRAEFLATAQVKAIASRREGERRVVLPVDNQMKIDAHYDLRQPTEGVSGAMALRLEQIWDAIAVLFAADGRTIRVLGSNGENPDDLIEIVMPEAPLKAAVTEYAMNVLWLSAIISLITAGLVYVALNRLLVGPMRRISRSMLHFSQNPEDPERIIALSGRTDEIGAAERELAAMQRQLAGLLLQKNRLAQLGLAVSKVNHDLRNLLANAQLISDRLTSIPDPTVQRFAPKLIASLDRAINFCNDSLRFGRAEEAAPRRELAPLKPIIEEVGDALGLPRDKVTEFKIEVPDTLSIDADREALFRILSNLTRNAVQAIESVGDGHAGEIRLNGWREGRRVFIEVRDNGPGVPQKARDNLFQPFKGSMRKGGTGLGLAIAFELAVAHGGKLELLDNGPGAVFLLEIPDRGTPHT